VLKNVLLLLSTSLLAMAFLWHGEWIMILILPAAPVFWIAFRGQSILWRSSCLLVAYVALAALVVLQGLPVALLVVGVAAALGAWDLTNFAQALVVAAGADDAVPLRRAHLQSLAVALSAGISLSFVGFAANLDLPFAVVGLLALSAIACLAAAARSLSGTNR